MTKHAINNAMAWLKTITELVGQIDQTDEGESDKAREEIHGSALSVMTRAGWKSPGEEYPDPEEYEILLTTGGPGLRIYGGLTTWAEPKTAELQWQDWGEPWTSIALSADERAALLTFASTFYFGEA